MVNRLISKLQDILARAELLDGDLEDLDKETIEAFLGDEEEARKCAELLRVARVDLSSTRSLVEAVRKRIMESQEEKCEVY